MDLGLIKTISARKKIKLDDLAKMANITRSTFFNYLSGKTDIPAETLKTLSDILDIPIAQLFNEYDSFMLLESGEPIPGYSSGKNTREVPLVHKFTTEDYLLAYEQEEFLNKLPRYPVLVEGRQKGNHLCFEISGDSMYDGSVESRMAGDIILVREFDEKQLISHPENSKTNFMIVHRNEGLMLRRVIGYSKENNAVTVGSLNAQYEERKLELKDIFKLFVEIKLVGRDSQS